MKSRRECDGHSPVVAAYDAADIEAIDQLLADDVVFHVPGRHPLSGTYLGKSQVFGYMGQVAALNESKDEGFEIHSVIGDDDHVVSLVTGTVEHDGFSSSGRRSMFSTSTGLR